MSPPQPEDLHRLNEELHALRAELERLNRHRFIRLYDNLWRLGALQLFRGLAFGLGSVLGATLLVSGFVYVLSSIDFIPVIGKWAAEIVQQVQEAGTR